MLTINDVCERLSISRYSARKIILSGELKSLNINGRYRIKPEWLDDYMNRAVTA